MCKVFKLPLFAVALSVSFLVSGQTTTETPQLTLEQAKQKFARFLEIVESKYMDEINAGKLVDDAITEILLQLDPHSVYFTETELKQANEPLEGNFEGVGIQFNILKDTIIVVNTISGGPSEKVGILSGDKIVMIDGENVAGISINNKGVTDRLRGKKGTNVEVMILRRGVKKNLEFRITRDVIPLYSIDASYMASPETGYIRLSKFSATTVEEFQKAVKELKAEGMKNLIFDLRGNGGGYLNAAIDLGDEFLGSGKLIVYTEGRAYPRQDAIATSFGSMESGKIVVLIDEGSASASEIVSGALQDWDRALIIGRRSFGKGLVQRPFNLTDGSAIRLTVSKYFTPSGRSIQKPYEEGVEAYQSELNKRLESGELTADMHLEFPDSLKYYTDGKRVVYGGGGIMPDIYIALDTSWATDYYADVVGKGIVNQFALDYVNTHRTEFTTKYSDPFMFNANYVLDDEVWSAFFKYAENEGIVYNDEQFQICKSKLTQMLKASLARDIYDFEAFWIVYNTFDDAYLKALETFNDDTFSKMKIAIK